MLSIQRISHHEDFVRAREFVDAHHSYIQWSDRPSRKMYWMCIEDDCLVGVFGLASAFARPKKIQEYMEKYQIQFNELGNNIVFCLYGTQTKNAGSQFLKMIRNDAVIWWSIRYGDKLKALQTFILPPRTGALYKADNWNCIGSTSGNVQTVRTIQLKDLDKYAGQHIERREFKSGEIKYLLREFSDTPQKLIFLRRL